MVRTAAGVLASSEAATATAQVFHPPKTDIPNTGITDHSCVTPAHGTLPWGSHYRNLVTAPGHAWVAHALEADTQAEAAAARALVLAAAHEHDDNDDIPVLGAYSDWSVLANSVEGSAAAVARVFGTGVSATVRLASVDVALSSGTIGMDWVGNGTVHLARGPCIRCAAAR